ncbi:hypothetical protein CPT03_09925 [Pedobacter ginsengisoli]|uniref:DUF4350 domain-containing protein n=1 Tax=Pedobacter ginsengisoli TaxID=363852 RepID=A0A2D1U585_9SPHI|nr:hypothetical protein [Pedobacter ginsengisoli]ATP56769.1 hypothetical protein CPT03_09925 [Pedobacter ginsengisoli]
MRLNNIGFSLMLLCGSISIANAQQSKVVTLDNFFNHETKKDKDGNDIRFHYTWEDQTLNGYSILGNIFKANGFQIKNLDSGPTLTSLKSTDIYIIVDPDNTREAPNPNYINKQHIHTITKWVKAGGILALLANDSANTNLTQLNVLAKNFGINFSNKNRNMVKGKNYETGTVNVPQGNDVFTASKKFYIKELSILQLNAPAQALITEQNDIIMATAKYGKGFVFALGDPWIYNEYVDGTRIPSTYENYNGAVELVKWLSSKISHQ